MQSSSTDRRHTRSEMLAVQRLLAVPAVCDALRSSGALDRLIDGPTTVDEIATPLDLDREGLRRLLVAAEQLGIVHRDASRWTTSVTHEALAGADRSWRSLAELLKGAERTQRSDDARHAGAIYRSVACRLPDLYGDAPDRLVESLDPVEGRILDVGAGAAPWSIAMLQAWPGTTATALDLPDVVGVTERAYARCELADRADVVGSDLWSAEFDAVFDVIVVAGVCHLFATDRVALLLARIVRWLRSGGRVVIVDAGGSSATTSLDTAIHDLSLWVRSGGGHRDAATHLRWLIDAGLTRAATVDIGTDQLVAVTAILEDQT